MAVQKRKASTEVADDAKNEKNKQMPTPSVNGFSIIFILFVILTCGVAFVVAYNPAGTGDMITSHLPESFSSYLPETKIGSTSEVAYPLPPIDELHFDIIVPGNPATPSVSAGDTVKLHVKGITRMGEVFWSTGEPMQAGDFETKVGAARLIKGFDKGVQGMHIGELRRIYIPWRDAYGENGMPPKIPAKMDLVFEVQLHSFVE